ncbi:MAG: 16S rRNA (uracil(1498)-N(3))-methyltransferase [Pyrinomonadaceae bacterium]
MRRFFAPPENINDNHVTLDESETRHLRDVLRLRSGETVYIFDGEGNEYECRIDQIGKRDTRLSVVQTVQPPAAESTLDLAICSSILKGDKTDFAIPKLVELGVNRFVPMLSARCDVKPKDAGKRVERWRKLAFEASKQCGRARLMTIEAVTDFTSCLSREAQNKDRDLILFSERDGKPFSISKSPVSIAAFLGPEGGWDDDEIEAAAKLGADVITLHGRIMKADTAAIAISAILQHRFGDLH